MACKKEGLVGSIPHSDPTSPSHSRPWKPVSVLTLGFRGIDAQAACAGALVLRRRAVMIAMPVLASAMTARTAPPMVTCFRPSALSASPDTSAQYASVAVTAAFHAQAFEGMASRCLNGARGRAHVFHMCAPLAVFDQKRKDANVNVLNHRWHLV